MTAGTPLTAADVGRFLRGRLGDVAGLVELGRGEWSVAFEFAHGGREYVARFGHHIEDFEKDRLAARYKGPALPVPAVIETGEALGQSYAISERVRGDFLDHLDQPRLQRALPSLLAALDAMRTADVSPASGYGMWDGHGRAPFATWQEALLDIAHDRAGGRVAGWRERLASSPIGDGPFNEAMERLRHIVEECPSERHLLHTDLLNRNVFVERDRIAGVIDWGNAMYGDFVYELAGFTFWSPWYTQWPDIDLAAEARRHYEAIGLDVPRFDLRLSCYELQIGLDGCAYNAFLGRWDDLAWTTRRTREVLSRIP